MARRAWLVLLCAVLAGCGGGDPGSPAPPAPPSPSAVEDPVRLVGSWRLDGVDEPGAMLFLDGEGQQLSVWRRCGKLTGSWRADEHGLFAASVYGTVGCPLPQLDTPEWLARAAGYRVEGGAPVLLDRAGAVVTRLGAGGPATPVPEYMRPEDAQPPTVTDRARRQLAPAAPLPADLTPAGRDALLGRWEPRSSRKPYLELRADGTWGGSDGCNGGSGRWVSGPDGALLATSGPTTGVACEGAPVPSWLAGARRAAVDGDTLVLVGGDGRELGRIPRAG